MKSDLILELQNAQRELRAVRINIEAQAYYLKWFATESNLDNKQRKFVEDIADRLEEEANKL